jgi:hypothetical protein
MSSKKLILLEKNPILLYADTGAHLLKKNTSARPVKKSESDKSPARKSIRARKIVSPPVSPLPPPSAKRRTRAKGA